ncbi:MAG: hypothetical protein GY930_14410, partial [bacterium]|nr:hypothetical protein [bacterium]
MVYRFALPLLITLPLASSAMAVPALVLQTGEAPWPSLPDIGDTARMDPEVVSLVQNQMTAVSEAMASGEPSDPVAQGIVGTAYAELGLAFEANTMWTPAIACYENAFRLIPGEDRLRDP